MAPNVSSLHCSIFYFNFISLRRYGEVKDEKGGKGANRMSGNKKGFHDPREGKGGKRKSGPQYDYASQQMQKQNWSWEEQNWWRYGGGPSSSTQHWWG